jgi:HEPN domain-containing protein
MPYVALLGMMEALQALIERRPASDLDRLDTETRCPDALPDVIPAEFFSVEDAEAAIGQAERILEAAAAHLRGA